MAIKVLEKKSDLMIIVVVIIFLVVYIFGVAYGHRADTIPKSQQNDTTQIQNTNEAAPSPSGTPIVPDTTKNQNLNTKQTTTAPSTTKPISEENDN
ncbi:MAG: hypothetical protein WCJ60_03390 [bacterium]